MTLGCRHPSLSTSFHETQSAPQQQLLLSKDSPRRPKTVVIVRNVSSSPSSVEPPQTSVVRAANFTTPTRSRLLLLGIMMHVERKHDYLSGALRALAQSELSLATTLTGSDVRVLVYDATPNQPSKQAENAKKMFGDDTLFDFSRGQGSQKHAISNAAKQSRDVASAAEAALSNYDFHYALLLEDDWIPCKGLFSSLMLALEAARRTFGSDVMAVRVSYGLNGVLIPRDPLSSFADFVRQRAGRIPPDHALTRWAQQRGKLVTFRHNQFVHVGAQSSIGNSGQRWNTACYELLFDWLEIESEAFQIDACGHDVISPCSPKAEDAKKNPTPQRRHKKFTCDVALKEFPAYLASARLGACVVDAIPSSKLTTSKLFHSQTSRSLIR